MQCSSAPVSNSSCSGFFDFFSKTPCEIVDASGKLVSTEIRKGLDEDARKKILDYLHGSISPEQVDEYEHQYQVAVQKQEADFKKVMLAVNDIEKAFSHGNPWLMKFRAISIPEKLERTHLKEWLDHVWIVDFEQVEVILQESEWKRFFPEEWLNNGEEDCNGKKE